MEWQTLFVETNGLKLHLYRGGVRGGVPVVLLHGITDNGLFWEPVAITLADTYDVIMIDARGHGQSDKPGTYGIAQHAADVAGIIDALGLDHPVLIGHSMGAATAATAAQQYPDKVRALVLEDPPWREDPPNKNDEWEQFVTEWHAWLVATKTRSLDDLIAQKRTESPHWSEDDMRVWAQSKHEVDPAVLHMGDQPPAMGGYDLAAALTCPTLLVTGDVTRGSMVPPDLAARIATLPGFEMVQIADAGHNIRQDQFVPYMEAVNAYLKRVVAG